MPGSGCEPLARGPSVGNSEGRGAGLGPGAEGAAAAERLFPARPGARAAGGRPSLPLRPPSSSLASVVAAAEVQAAPARPWTPAGIAPGRLAPAAGGSARRGPLLGASPTPRPALPSTHRGPPQGRRPDSGARAPPALPTRPSFPAPAPRPRFNPPAHGRARPWSAAGGVPHRKREALRKGTEGGRGQ